MPQSTSHQPQQALKHLRPVIGLVLLVLKPLSRILWFIFEWPIKLAPILIIGGYSAALWEVDNKFLEQARTARINQTQLRTYDYLREHVLVPDSKYYAITTQEASARANMDRGKLIKAQFSFTLFALGNEIGTLLSHPFSYPYREIGHRLLAVYDHIQFMPAEAIETIVDGNWDTELSFDDDFKNLDKLNNDYTGLATKEVNVNWQAHNQPFYTNRIDYRHTAAGTKSRKTLKSEEPVKTENSTQSPPERALQEKCSELAFNQVKDMEANIKKQSASLNQKNLNIDLEEFEIDAYHQCLEKNKNVNPKN